MRVMIAAGGEPRAAGYASARHAAILPSGDDRSDRAKTVQPKISRKKVAEQPELSRLRKG
jgi:hypothetical protein